VKPSSSYSFCRKRSPFCTTSALLNEPSLLISSRSAAGQSSELAQSSGAASFSSCAVVMLCACSRYAAIVSASSLGAPIFT